MLEASRFALVQFSLRLQHSLARADHHHQTEVALVVLVQRRRTLAALAQRCAVELIGHEVDDVTRGRSACDLKLHSGAFAQASLVRRADADE